MKYIFCFILGLFLHITCMAQFGYITTKDEKKGGTILVGEINEKIIDSIGEYTWFKEGKKTYKIDSNKLAVLQKIISPYRFVVFAGTWCEDTQLLLPQLYNVFNQLHINADKIKLYGVDRKKKALNKDSEIYKIDFVPTIIIYNENREVARIVETVSTSIESDLLYLIEKDIALNKEK